MLLSQNTFKEHLRQNRLKLCLTGMSNIGKSYWANKLEKAGFKRYSCDEIIERKLALILEKAYPKGISEMANWLGKPTDSDYQKKEKLYLHFESEALEEILAELEKKVEQNTVLDSTGSFIYAPKGLIGKIMKKSLVIYLQESDNFRKALSDSFLISPKPLIWGSSFRKKAENPYQELLTFRAEKYLLFSDLAVFAEALEKLETGQQFLEMIYEILQH